MITLLSILHIVVSILLIILVLLQFGKGAEAGLVFNTEASSILPQSGNFISKFTSGLAAAFLILSLTLSVLKGHQSTKSILDDQIPNQVAPLTPEEGKKAEPATSTESKSVETPTETSNKNAK